MLSIPIESDGEPEPGLSLLFMVTPVATSLELDFNILAPEPEPEHKEVVELDDEVVETRHIRISEKLRVLTVHR